MFKNKIIFVAFPIYCIFQSIIIININIYFQTMIQKGQRIEGTKGQKKNIPSSQIVYFKNKKVSVLPKKPTLHHHIQISQSFPHNEEENISKISNHIFKNDEPIRSSIRERKLSELKDQKRETGERGKSLKYWKVSSEPKFMQTIKGFFNNIMVSDNECCCGKECKEAKKWIQWVNVPYQIVEKHYLELCHEVDPLKYGKKGTENEFFDSQEENDSMKLEKQKIYSQISKDIKRTQSSHQFFRNQQIQEKGELILKCYAHQDYEVGYIQGMNIIMSGFLYHIKDEVQTFAVVRKIFHEIRPIYLNNFQICSQHIAKIIQLVQFNVNDLFEHFTEVGIDLKIVCFPWMISLMAVLVPLNYLHFIYNGFIRDKWDFIYRIALAIFIYHKDELLEMDEIGDILVFLSSTREKKEDKNWLDLIEYAEELKKVI